MNREDIQQLRELRSTATDADFKGLMRRTLNHITLLEDKLQEVRTFAKAIDNTAKIKTEQDQ